jgi:Lysine methyltransferase
MIVSRVNASLALEFALLKRKREPLGGAGCNTLSSSSSCWERETGRGVRHDFGEYRLSICTLDSDTNSTTTTKVVIQEDCSSIATRVWDCAVLTTKWLEHQAMLLRSDNGILDLRDALKLPSVDPTTEGASSPRPPPIQVLELGSGMGLLSICLAKMGAAVMSTEYGSAVSHLQQNCELNQVSRRQQKDDDATTLRAGEVVCRDLDWYKTTETLQSLFLPNHRDRAMFDLLAVTDCSLTMKDSMGVLDMIHKYGTPGHTKVLVGLCREREGTPYFIQTAKQLFPHGVTTIPTSDYPADFQTNRHIILLIQL